MGHQCDKCGKSFAYPCRLRDHLRRKTPCTAVVESHELSLEDQAKDHACRFCGHRFASPQGVSQHLKKFCKIAGSAEGMEKLYNHTLKKQLLQQQAQIDALTSQVQALTLPDAPPMVAQQAATIINGPVTATVTNHVTINMFGGEKIDHIERCNVRELLDKTLATGQSPLDSALQALIRAAALIYSDPSHPENLTCYIPNKKNDEVMIHGDAGWEVQPCQVVLPPMAMRSCNLLFNKQPFEDAEPYGDLMIALRDNEEAFKKGKQMRTILVRNKDLISSLLQRK